MGQIYIPTRGAGDWQRLLAEPDKQWRTGFSAKSAAHCWEAADGLPPDVAALFRECPDFGDASPELLAAFPEWKVPLPGGRRESQNDVFALVRCGEATAAVMVEAKVAEPFGPTLGEWLDQPSPGKLERLAYIAELLGLSDQPPDGIRYQLLHRTASAVIEARRFGTTMAAMVVQSFSLERLWFNDFAAFCDLFGADGRAGALVRAGTGGARPLYLGWAEGDARFLSA